MSHEVLSYSIQGFNHIFRDSIHPEMTPDDWFQGQSIDYSISLILEAIHNKTIGK